MKCLICGSDSHHYFSKTYTEHPFDGFMREIGNVDYHRCVHCGFVASKTHAELDEDRWNNLNLRFHHWLQDPASEKKGNQPPYAEQAMMLNLLSRNGIIDTTSMLDYAAGYGTLSDILARYHDTRLPLFDPYVNAGDPTRYVDASDLATYKTVINSAMFEHVLRREDLDKVNQIVDIDGCMVIHTVVCENVPKDANWFYLRFPVHTAFHTNKSMDILMSQWGYRSSIYCPKSKSWVLLRQKVDVIEKEIARLNQELQSEWFHCKNGFVDYWKGF